MDNDCDGTSDEGFPLGQMCEVALGGMTRTGVRFCAAAIGEMVCGTPPECTPDQDGDGVAPCAISDDIPADCGDTDPSINPNMLELCDTIDNDCDGIVDEANGGETIVHRPQLIQSRESFCRTGATCGLFPGGGCVADCLQRYSDGDPLAWHLWSGLPNVSPEAATSC